MLTSIFYYNIYRPYLVGNVTNRGNSIYTPKKERINTGRERPDQSGRIFVLNKALRNEIVEYAQAVSHGVTDFREATKHTVTSMETFNRTVHREGYYYAVENLAYDLDSFASYFNKSSAFLQTQIHSDGLRAYSSEIAENIYHNRERLEMLGITLSGDGNMYFSKDQVTSMTHQEINLAIGENLAIFEGLRAFSGQLLTEPLLEHMRFTGLKYHYNYRLGTMEAEGYSLIEAGMLVDKRV